MASPGAEGAGKQVRAENRSTGSQFLADGHGDLNAASGNGVVYKDHRVFNFATPGIPLGWNLAETLNGMGNALHRPQNAAICEWLKKQKGSPPLDACRQYYVETKSQMVNGTGSWILQNEQFRAWKDPTSLSTKLALEGILGSGKTMLATHIIDSLSQEIKGQAGVACIYFYFHAGSSVSPDRVWATLLYQLLQFESPKGITSDLTSSFQGLTSLCASEYYDLFVAQVSMFNGVSLIFDGLDTWSSEQAQECVQNSLRTMPGNVKILFTARSDAVARRLATKQTIRVKPSASDVKAYIETRIDGHTGLSQILSNNADRVNVVEKVADSVLRSGMFLLARLHLDKISKQVLLADIHETLLHLSQDSGSAFNSCVAQIVNEPRSSKNQLAKHVLTWIVHAKANPTIKLLQDSFAIQRSKGACSRKYRPPGDTMISACAGLVVVDQGHLSLVHDSVKKHLYEHQLVPLVADLEIAKTCLMCLLSDEPRDESRADTEPASLLSYAASHSFFHLERMNYGKLDPETTELLHEFLCNKAKLTRAFESMPKIDELKVAGLTGLHAAVYFGNEPLAKEILERGAVDINARGIDGQTALHWAVRLSHIQLVRFLTGEKADNNIKDKSGDTPLHKALIGHNRDHLELVQILIGGGARIDIRGAKGYTPLSWAIRYGPTEVAKLLITSQKNVTSEVEKGWTTLREVFFHGYEIVQNFPPGELKTVQEAVESHVKSLTDLLLDQPLDLNHPTSDGWLPLIHIVRVGSAGILEKLLTRQSGPADPNLKDSDSHRSPLRWAMFYKRKDRARILIDHGANANEQDDDGWTPLIQAVQDNDQDLVWLLLNNGASPNALNRKNTPALVHAIESGNPNLAWLLVTHGADVTQLNNRALELALEKDDIMTASLLCLHKANPNFTSRDGKTQLHKASRNGNAKVVEFLLNQGAEVGRKDNEGSTALHYAVLGHFVKITMLLACHASQKDLELCDAHGNSPVILATRKQHTAVLRTLLCNGASCDVRCPQELTALHYAAIEHYDEGLEILLRHTEKVDITDPRGYTALHHAAYNRSNHCRAISLLVLGGANLDSRDRNGCTPLIVATQARNRVAMGQLIQLGADIHLQNDRGWTALKLARWKQDESLVQILEAAGDGDISH